MSTKVINSNKGVLNKNNTPLLDTLAQLSTGHHNDLISKGLQQKLAFQKRARSKSFNQSFILDLVDLNSPLKDAYWSTFHCSSVLIQNESNVSSKYCKQRWCLVCNRIRTANMINGYKEPLSKLKETQFVTLTVVNPKGKHLKSTIEHMNESLKDIRKNLKKTYGITLKGLRKYECTYNEKDNTYHPHYHLIIEGKEQSEKLKELWLKKNPTSKHWCQVIEPTREGTEKELFKYMTKVITKDNDYNPKALDIMFRAFKGKRTIQPIGIKKYVSEDIEEIQSQEIEFKAPQKEIFVWEYKHFDWVSAEYELFSEYTPTKEDRKVINQDYKKIKQ
jgi:hypothetical protein